MGLSLCHPWRHDHVCVCVAQNAPSWTCMLISMTGICMKNYRMISIIIPGICHEIVLFISNSKEFIVAVALCAFTFMHDCLSV
jgi:hypothetical protein